MNAKNSIIGGNFIGNAIGSTINLGLGLLNGLLWYYQLGESGGPRLDSSPSDLVLSEIGAVGSDTGIIGQAAKFNGLSTNNLSHSFDSAYVLADFTFTGWFNIADKSTDRMIQYIGDGADSNNQRIVEIAYDQVEDALKVAISDGSVADLAREDIGGTIPVSQFVFYAIRWDNTTETLEIRLNGQAFTAFPFSRKPHSTGTQSFVLGSNKSGLDPWISLIDEIGGWDRKLADSEVDFLYNEGNGQRPNLTNFVINADSNRVVNDDSEFIIT